MNKKILSIASAGIALVAYAGYVFADTTTTATPTSSTTEVSTHSRTEQAPHHQHGPFVNQEVLTLLNIDSATLQGDFESGQSLADIAKAQGKTEQDVIDLLVGQATKRIDQSVSSGKLTQEKADQMKSTLPDRMKHMVEQKGGFFKKHGKRRGNDNPFKVIASVTGIDQQELMTKVKAGESIAQIAQEHNISEQDLIDKLLQKDKERITKLVEKTWKKNTQSNNQTQPNTTNQ